MIRHWVKQSSNPVLFDLRLRTVGFVDCVANLWLCSWALLLHLDYLNHMMPRFKATIKEFGVKELPGVVTKWYLSEIGKGES